MRTNARTISFLLALVSPLTVSGLALAAPGAQAGANQSTASQSTAILGPKQARPRATMRLDVGQPSPYVGQAVPFTVTAFFRDVEGVTLLGPVQLDTKSVVTSELAQDPKQSTEIIDGEPRLVVRWTGKLTPSTSGPLDLTAALPMKIRWREAAPRAVLRDTSNEDPFADTGGDPFADLGAGDPFGAGLMQHLRERMLHMRREMEQPVGRVHDETMNLHARVPALDVKALPVDGQPSTFSGAVGRYSLDATLSSAHVQVSEPLTLRVAVEGTGDLDRVDLPGVQTSDTWKAYPPKATREPAVKGHAERKVFEQVLVPLHGGNLSVPAVSFTSFDPTTGHYVAKETAPLMVTADGPAAAPVAPPMASTESALVPQTDPQGPAAAPAKAWPRPTLHGMKVGALGIFLVAFAISIGLALRKRLAVTRSERLLRSSMRRAAAEGSSTRFFDAAHGLIETRLAKLWHLASAEVTSTQIAERLGDRGQTLTDVLQTHDAMAIRAGRCAGARFARALFRRRAVPPASRTRAVDSSRDASRGRRFAP